MNCQVGPKITNASNDESYEQIGESAGEGKEQVDREQVVPIEEANVENSRSLLQKEFDALLKNYIITVNVTTGCNAQWVIDNAYAKLERFASEHKEFKGQLPERAQTGIFDLNIALDYIYQQPVFEETIFQSSPKASPRREEDCVLQ
jgi:hypothetical protein